MKFKNGKILRELNRSFYCANAYDYPIALAQGSAGNTLLIHCPEEFNILEVQDVVASGIEALQAMFPSDGDASNSGAARFEKLIAGHLAAPTPVPTRSFGDERATGLRAILDDRIHAAGRPGDKVK